MPRKSRPAKPRARSGGRVTTLRSLADYLGFAPATVSLVINRSPVADSIPEKTKELILAAARKFNYRPNFMARSLRQQRSFTVGVMVPEVSEGYAALVMSGIEDALLRAGYFYFVASHRHKPDLLDEYPKLLYDRSVEGIIAVDTPFHHPLGVPVVVVSGQAHCKGITTVCLNQQRAAELAVGHLAGLGHTKIAFIKGQAFSSDTETRWEAVTEAARKCGIPVDADLVVQLEGDTPGPELGYEVTRKLLKRAGHFTAIFAFNDISAIGAIRALREHALRVPEDVSVVGFDDIQSAAFQNPPLTTVRQPLRKMGELAAQTLVRRIRENGGAPELITVEPEFVLRRTTAAARKQ